MKYKISRGAPIGNPIDIVNVKEICADYIIDEGKCFGVYIDNKRVHGHLKMFINNIKDETGSIIYKFK